MTETVFTGKAIETNNGNLFVTCTLNAEQFLFYMDPKGNYLVSKTQITGKMPKITPQEFAWAKSGFGTNIPSKVRKLTELETQNAKKIVFAIKKDAHFGFSKEQLALREEKLREMILGVKVACK